MKPAVLIVTYYWPPSGGAAVQRWLSLANELAEAGWDVHVLTVAEAYATYQLYDPSLVAQVDSRVQVHPTRTLEPFGLYKTLFGKNSLPKPAFSDETKPSLLKKVSRFIRGNFFLPDPRKGWRPYAVRKARALLAGHAIRTVITAGPPHSTHFIGLDLKRATPGLRWIADFHDLWTDVIYYDLLYHLPIVKRLDRKLERKILESADLVLAVGDRYRDKLLEKSPRLQPSGIAVLRIGYDEKAFRLAPPPRTEAAFTITYSGTIADFYHPEAFLNALQAVVHRHRATAFRLRFVGVLSPAIRAHIGQLGLLPILEETGYLPHRAAVEWLLRSDLLLLVSPVTRDEAMVIPGKVYEYMAARKPVLNLTTAGSETAALLSGCGSGRSFARNEQAAMEAWLEELVAQWSAAGALPPAGDEACLAHYSRRAIAATLDQLLRQ